MFVMLLMLSLLCTLEILLEQVTEKVTYEYSSLL